jgi:hypothetical protein
LKKPLEYAFVLAVLILYRLIAWIATRKDSASVPPAVERASRPLPS